MPHSGSPCPRVANASAKVVLFGEIRKGEGRKNMFFLHMCAFFCIFAVRYSPVGRKTSRGIRDNKTNARRVLYREKIWQMIF